MSLAVLTSTEQAATLLDPLRLDILARLRTADSSAGVARALGLPRQRVNYHVGELEKAGLLEFVGERRRGNYIERLLQATATQYVIGADALGALGADASEVQDRFSAAYLIASASRTINEVAQLEQAAHAAQKRLPTYTLETEVRFASAEQQSGFASELSECVAALVAKYNDDTAPRGRRFRFVIGGHPAK
jgi:DNA-binding transcriptional ArsR family regulator